MSSILASSSSLLGPLAPINKYVLAHAQPFTSINWLYLLLPMIPLFVQCYLIGFEGTRSWRIAMAVVGLMMMTSAITSYRFFSGWIWSRMFHYTVSDM